MAISQTKYIDIHSQIANFPIGNRDLSGLVITGSDMLSQTDTALAAVKTAYDAGTVITVSLDETRSLFGATSNEYLFASKYFGYVTPTGSTPRAISFAKCLKEDDTFETANEAFTRISESTDGFGSFTFLSTTTHEFTLSDIKTALQTNAGLNNKFLGSVGEQYTTASDATTAAGTTLGAISGAVYTVGADAYAAAMPMAMLAATNYGGTNTVLCYMFKQFPGETAVVKTDTEYEALKAANVNFYGQTQANGKNISFYQRGFNLDGVDTAVYCNEMWLKSSISAALLNYFTTVTRIPANYVGAGMLRSVIIDSVLQGLRNGTIMPGKTLNQAQKSLVYQYSGVEDAYVAVESDGYWMDIVIEAEGNDYKAVYRLIYSKGDSIRFIDGTHYLV